MKPLIIIPARMGSSRLPGKPLADIHGLPMIVHVMRCAENAEAARVCVACAEQEIADAVIAAGGEAVMTPADLPSGTDRVRVAADILDPDKEHDIIVNVQGDMPTLDPRLVSDVIRALGGNDDCDIATAVVATDCQREKQDPNVVKAVIGENGRALYFSRANTPSGDGPVFHHIGLYAYRRASLEKFCQLPPSPLEIRERLEQLRALENGMIIHAAIVDAAPHGVDTPEDLERAREMLDTAK